MSQTPLYPLRFEPLYQHRLWGGRRLAELLSAPHPYTEGDPIGEAWVLSDRDDHSSLVANGPLKGRTLGQLLEQYREPLLGQLAAGWRRFPLLLKFLDARQALSVQVHPSDAHKELLPTGEAGKTEAWVVMEAGATSHIYAGLKPGTDADVLRRSLAAGTVADLLMDFTPKPGDGFFLPAGTVHALGGDVVVFEVQQNSDVTFRLYDWDRIDIATGCARPLQVEQGLACIDFSPAAVGPVRPVLEGSPRGGGHEAAALVKRERLFQCEQFCLWRLRGHSPFAVGAAGLPRVLVGIEGTGQVEYAGTEYVVARGDVLLLPAVVGTCRFRPHGTVNMLEIGLPCKIAQPEP